MTEEREQFTEKTSDLANTTGIDQARINRYRSKRIVPEEYVSKNQTAGRWRYMPDAADWIALAFRIGRAWATTEDEISDVFIKARQQCGGVNKALKVLTKAYEMTRNFEEFKNKIEC